MTILSRKDEFSMTNRKGRTLKNRINKVLEVPEEVALRVPKLTILKFEEVLIENYKGILEYQDFYVRIQTYMGIININGYRLTLEEMTTDDLLVKGKIESIDFQDMQPRRFSLLAYNCPYMQVVMSL